MTLPLKAVSMPRLKVACSACSLHELCLPAGLQRDDLEIIKGDAYYQSYICHIPRSTIELGLSGRFLRGVVTRLEQRVGCENDSREVRSAQKRATHLFEHDAEFDEAESRATELFRHDEALETHLLAHL